MKKVILFLITLSTVIVSACTNTADEIETEDAVDEEVVEVEQDYKSSSDFLDEYIKVDENLVDLALETEGIDRISRDTVWRDHVQPLASLENPKDLSQYVETFYKGDIDSYEAHILLTISRYPQFFEYDSIFALDLDQKILTVIPQNKEIIEHIKEADRESYSTGTAARNYVLYTNELYHYLDEEYTVDIFLEDEVYMTLSWGASPSTPLYTKSRGVLYGELDESGDATYEEFRTFLKNENSYLSDIEDKFNDKEIEIEVDISRMPNNELTNEEDDIHNHDYTAFRVDILNLEWPGLIEHALTTRKEHEEAMIEYNEVLQVTSEIAEEVQNKFGKGFSIDIRFDKHSLDNPIVISADNGKITSDQIDEFLPEEEDMTFLDESGMFEESTEEDIDDLEHTPDAIELEDHITTYLNLLADFYNDESDEIFEYVKDGSPAYSKLKANKETGYFSNHTTYNVDLLEQESETDDTFVLNVTRIYEHDNSGGKNAANVNYILDSETHKIIDYEEQSNYTVDD